MSFRSLRRVLFVVIAIAFVGGVIVLDRRNQQESLRQIDIAQQALRPSPQNSPVTGTPDTPATDRDKRDSNSDAISRLVVRYLPQERFWFVGKDPNGGGLELPFNPRNGVRSEPRERTDTIDVNPGYVGMDQCVDCHQEKVLSVQGTAHAKTSSLASPEVFCGPFQGLDATVHTSEPGLHFDLLAREEKRFQRVSFYGYQTEVPMDIVIGSAKMAQAYLYWNGDELYQHNLSCLAEPPRWINSPGYVDGDAAYSRPIPPRCLDCHTTYFSHLDENRYESKSMLWGVTCERCHGPGREHVSHHSGQKENAFVDVVNPQSLNRQQKLDLCGQCHTGDITFETSPFQFRPGDALSDHYRAHSKANSSSFAVHTSNQLGRLKQSPCFQLTEMTCDDCHNPHVDERGKLKVFSDKCMRCHSVDDCGHRRQSHANTKESLNWSHADNCIDCHMPLVRSNSLRLDSSTERVFPALRDHFIRVDAESTRSFLGGLESP